MYLRPGPQDVITAVDQKNIVVVKTVGERDTYETLEEIAGMLAKMLNTDEADRGTGSIRNHGEPD